MFFVSSVVLIIRAAPELLLLRQLDLHQNVDLESYREDLLIRLSLIPSPLSSGSSWLRDNEPEATRRHQASLPRREELDRLKEELCRQFKVANVR